MIWFRIHDPGIKFFKWICRIMGTQITFATSYCFCNQIYQLEVKKFNKFSNFSQLHGFQTHFQVSFALTLHACMALRCLPIARVKHQKNVANSTKLFEERRK